MFLLWFVGAPSGWHKTNLSQASPEKTSFIHSRWDSGYVSVVNLFCCLAITWHHQVRFDRALDVFFPVSLPECFQPSGTFPNLRKAGFSPPVGVGLLDFKEKSTPSFLPSFLLPKKRKLHINQLDRRRSVPLDPVDMTFKPVETCPWGTTGRILRNFVWKIPYKHLEIRYPSLPSQSWSRGTSRSMCVWTWPPDFWDNCNRGLGNPGARNYLTHP